MNKVGRNEPCPCGSGKKYKKCCGASNVVEITPDLYNTELANLHAKLLDVAFEEYPHIISKVFEQNPQPELMDNQERLDSYMAGISSWVIMNEPVQQDGQTIFDIFYKRKQKKIKHSRTRNTLAEWGGRTPAVYEIISISDEPSEMARVQDMLTGSVYSVPFSEEDDFKEGNLGVGILIPFVQHHEFLFTMIELQGINREVMELAEEYGEEGLVEDFPDFLAEALTVNIDTFNIEWRNQQDEAVANLFTDHMQSKDVDDEIITTGVFIWNAYCHMNSPVIKKPAAFAAALEYLMYNSFYPDGYVTQKQVAEEYGTTSGTVSQKVRQLENSIDNEMADEIGKIIGNDLEDLIDATVDSENIEDFQKPQMELEQTMNDLQKVLEEQGFESEEDVKQFLNEVMESQQLPKPASTSPRDLAQDKLYEAQQTNRANKRKKLVEEALDIYPNSPDAYAIMAADATTINDQYQFFHQAVIAGEKDLGKDFFRENKGHFWLMTETRPYMRAKASFAEVCHTLGDTESTLAHYEELLELNPNDNQGIRYQLFPLYLETEEYDEAKELLKQFEGDISANFLFNHALLHYFTMGITSKTKTLLKEATKQNPYVKDYLTGKKAIPEQQLDFIGLGDENEAIAYAQEHIHLWSGEEELLKELQQI
ncbi:SEC-C metal-binding domain-containing protein [Virgibacillus ainsalahensis]